VCCLFWNGFLAFAHVSLTGFMTHGSTWNGFSVVGLANRPYDHIRLFHGTSDIWNII
jgi:hypothetical protein